MEVSGAQGQCSKRMETRLSGDHLNQALPFPVISSWKSFLSNKLASRALKKESQLHFKGNLRNVSLLFILTKLKIRNIKGKKTRKMSSTFVRKSSFQILLAFSSSSVSFLENLFLFKQLFFFFHKSQAYPNKAPHTKKMHTNIQAAIAVMPSVLGELVVMVLKILMSTRKRVMSIAIRPKK